MCSKLFVFNFVPVQTAIAEFTSWLISTGISVSRYKDHPYKKLSLLHKNDYNGFLMRKAYDS